MHMLVDLKICEGCGSLWYRALGVVDVYCHGCAARLVAYPAPEARRRPGGRRKQPVLPVGPCKVSAGAAR